MIPATKESRQPQQPQQQHYAVRVRIIIITCLVMPPEFYIHTCNLICHYTAFTTTNVPPTVLYHDFTACQVSAEEKQHRRFHLRHLGRTLVRLLPLVPARKVPVPVLPVSGPQIHSSRWPGSVVTACFPLPVFLPPPPNTLTTTTRILAPLDPTPTHRRPHSLWIRCRDSRRLCRGTAAMCPTTCSLTSRRRQGR